MSPKMGRVAGETGAVENLWVYLIHLSWDNIDASCVDLIESSVRERSLIAYNKSPFRVVGKVCDLVKSFLLFFLDHFLFFSTLTLLLNYFFIYE